jgi:deazaflavin-dependent oxidoreductase (nitroreductase family)
MTFSYGFTAELARVNADAGPGAACEHGRMPHSYRLTRPRRLLNRFMRALLQIGLAPSGMYLLTTTGRRTGTPHSTPVTLVEHEGGRWLVAPYGAVGWVRNARAAGRVRLSRGRRSEDFAIDELAGEAAATVLQTYLRQVRVVRPYFDAAPESPLSAFAEEVSQHPVFRLHAVTGPEPG